MLYIDTSKHTPEMMSWKNTSRVDFGTGASRLFGKFSASIVIIKANELKRYLFILQSPDRAPLIDFTSPSLIIFPLARIYSRPLTNQLFAGI